ncbi:helicase, partial [[Eubacterium] rectale]|nr:helicase [Agathobacter rectalis]
YWNANIDTTISNFQRQLHFLADPHPPTWFYYKACHALLQSTENPDDYIKPETGIYDSCVWNKLYSFQRDGVRAVIAKLMKHNGCILADSVGLGKTFEALAVIKYFLLRGANVLVLCPKRLRDNWSI